MLQSVQTHFFSITNDR